MPTCPNGHHSGSDDWCEVCGHRIDGAVPPPPPGYGFPPPAPGGAPGGGHAPAQPEYCPQCRTPREGGAPFCEECRWNFITNKATSYTPVAPRPAAGQSGPPPGRFPGPGGPGPGGPGGPPSAPHHPGGPPGPPGMGSGQDAFGHQGARSAPVNRPAEPFPPFGENPAGPPPPPPGPGAPGAPAAFRQGGPPAPPPYPGFPEAGQPGPPPPPPGQGFGGDDDWVISPPSAATGSGPAPNGPAGPGAGPGGGHPPHAQAGPVGFAPSDTWSVTIGPDREYFMSMMQRSGPEAAGLNLPAFAPQKQHQLIGNQITIGRRRHATGEVPDIDLAVPPEDPGVSHQHAVLVQQTGGSWAIVDQGSTNGTTVNGSDEPIQSYIPVPLQDGDRVHVGAWTTITIHRG
ncbi:FHA domain-containing protein [Streptomyces sp. NPDC049906]|uniref:FHA domain-containing protein n=1 Tax=Streptomyces sp. NPDC049906 TaxID=3155656 RepID=UPI003448FDBE